MRSRFRHLQEAFFWKLATLFGHLAMLLDRLSGKVRDAQLWAMDRALELFQATLPAMLPYESTAEPQVVPEAPASTPPVWLESPQAIEPPPAPVASFPGLQYPLSGGKLH